MGKFPELTEVEKTEYSEGYIKLLEHSLTYRSNTGIKKTSNKIMVIGYDHTKQGGGCLEDVFSLLHAAKKDFKDAENLVIMQAEGINKGTMRKMLEVVFGEERKNIMLLTQKEKEPEEKIFKKRGAVLIIEKPERSFAETVKLLRENLTTETTDIKNIKQTKNGNVLISVGETNKINAIRNKIEAAVQNSNIRISDRTSNRVSVIMRGLDCVTTVEEVQEKLREILGEENDFEVTPLRPIQRGNQVATIKLERSGADKLLNSKIRIGLSVSYLEERVDVRKCFRCWDYGHLAKNCNGEDRKDNCQRCNGKGHVAKQCSNEEFCPLCNRKGHSAGGGGCSTFTKALAAEKGKNAKRREEGLTFQHSQ